MSHVWIGLGSNLGEREENLCFAVDRLMSLGLAVLRVSNLYETRPVPPASADEPAYLNAVLHAETETPPEELLRLLHSIEAERGRDLARRAGPRSLDLDLLAFGPLRIDTPELRLPHPRLIDRAFVLVPLCELDPLWRHPEVDLTAAELLARLVLQPGQVRLFGPLRAASAGGHCDSAPSYPWRLLSPIS